MNILMAFIGLGFLIFIHELGHYWVGRATGIRVEQFAIGFGPAIARYTRKGIEYRINWIPLGGYVKFLGEDKVEGIDAPDSFQNRPIWARFFTLIAGVSMNVLGAILILTAMYTAYGTPDYTRCSIQAVSANSPAAVAGLKPNDEIVQVNHQPVVDLDTLKNQITSHPHQPVKLLIKRSDQMLTLTAVPNADQRIGVSVQPVYVHSNMLVNLKNGIQETGNMFTMLLDGLRQMVTGHVPLKDVSGPVEIISITSQASQLGIDRYLYVIAILSANLAVLNLLPLPALDGGRLVFLLVEWLRRGKRIPIEKEASINFIGLMFLFALMIIVTFKDITHLFS